MKRQQDLFDDSWSPTKIGFWSQPWHMLALIEGMSADEAEALRYEYNLVLSGERDILGRPCLCGDTTLACPPAVRGGRGGAHDSLGSIISLVVDLAHAADQLPLRWRETERIFIVQERGVEWRRRMGLASTGRKFRAEDFDPDLGRAHAWAIMAWHLGWQGLCRLPRRDVAKVLPFTPRAQPSVAA